MHPLFGHRIRLALYVLAWLLAGLPLALVVRAVVPQEVSRAHAFAVPLSLLYGFVVMSAWWVCRANPLNGERPIGAVITTQLGAGLQSSAAWCAIGTAWAVGLDRLAGPGPDRAGILTQVLLLFASGANDLPNIRALIDTVREVGACEGMKIAVGGGVFNRAEGLAEEIGADLWASDPAELVETLLMEPARRAAAEQRTVGRKRRKAA